ncbi:MAG: serine/threonine protein kinase [Deltaproteobacteria bacterium]|nr:serine/threonine protein kinase [Deltaproteobacteria bacterium]
MNAVPNQRFRILKTLGDGGMGTVYLAVMLGEGGFEKRVALKKLKPELSQDPESVELFMREAKLAAQLNHPNIVQVFDGGLDQGNLFLVLEYVDGGDLEGVIRSSRKRGKAVSPAAIAHVGAQVCEALCCLFDLRDDKGAPQVQAHRDISPSNVLLAKNGVVKLSDFGVVRLRESKTAIGKVRGKWEYFPPELVRGSHDQRGDLFALGVTLYKLAAMKHPFEAPTPPQHFERACKEQPAPIAGLPDALWGIINRALSKDPKQRYQTAEEMGADLDAFVTACDARISPRYLARELFAAETEVSLPAAPPSDTAPTQMATGLDLFDDFQPGARRKTGGVPIPSRTEDELRQFEDVFGPLPDRTGTGPRVDINKTDKNESSSGSGLLVRGPMSESQLRTLYKDFADRYYKHRNQAPPVSFEQLALMIQSRRAQLQQKFPNCAVTVNVVLQNDKVIVKLRPVNEAGQRLG